MANHRITTATAQRIADDRRRGRYAPPPPSAAIPAPGGEYPRVHPVQLTAAIGASSGGTPSSGPATLHRFNPHTGALEAIRSLTVYSVADAALDSGSWQLAHQDPYGRFWLSSAAGSPGSGGGEETPKPAFLVAAVIDTSATGGYGDTPTVYGANASAENAAIKATPQVILSPPPYSIYSPLTSVANPFGLNGIDGDECLIGWDETNARYFLQEVYPAKSPFLFELTIRPAGLGTTMSVEPKHSIGAGSGSMSVKDLGNVAIGARNGDTGFAVWSQEDDAFVCIWCSREATECTATVAANFDESDADVTIELAVGLNGRTPSPAVTTVKNRYKRFGADGQKCEIKWDPTAEEWYLLQVECDDNTVPGMAP